MTNNYSSFLFLMYFGWITTLLAQPRYDLASCYFENGEGFKIVLIASEMDVYSLKRIPNVLMPPKSFWNQFIEQSFIHDYNFKFGKVIKTETSQGYFLMLTPKGKKNLQLSIHKSGDLKTVIRSIQCQK
jgi:hypothetical protein